MDTPRIPRHVGFIPDGNRRWAEARGLPKSAGYEAGIEPGLRLLAACRAAGVEEVSVYGFTKENVHRAADQVAAFRTACGDFARRVVEAGVALLVVGDTNTPMFPDSLRRYAEERTPGDIRVNLLVNYGWQWDLFAGQQRRTSTPLSYSAVPASLGSSAVSRIELVIRWGGRRRLSGFLPVQSAYADFYVLDTLWPDMQPEEFSEALAWYQEQDVTMGG